MRDGALKIVAETTPNGGPQRWLNPAGIGHFLGNGRRQVALVRMPHAVGRLEFWDFDGKALRLHGAIDDTSNHRIGSDRLKLSAVLSGGAGKPDLLAIPDFARRRLRLIAAVPAPHQISATPVKAPMVGNLEVHATGEGAEIVVPTEDGAGGRLLLPGLAPR